MRRPPIACRRAVQSLQSPVPQHVWISDDLLSVALNRFFRSTCPHQKRHGSHVPGPLEARRRAAKRRMTVSANFYPQDSFPPPFSLGALFGFRKDSRPSWRYEPPSLPQTAEPLDLLPSIPSPSFQFDSIPQAESTAPISRPSPYRASPSFSQTSPTILGKQETAVEPSVESLLESVKSTTKSKDVDFKICFETFKSRIAHAGDLSELDRNNLVRKAFRSCCPPHSEAWMYNVLVIEHLTELIWDPAPLIGKKAYLAVPPTYTAQSLELLNCIEKLSIRFPSRLQHFHRLNVKLAEAAVQAETSRSSTQDTELLFLIQQLWQSTYPQIGHVKRSAMVLLCEVARKIRDRYTAQALQTVLADIEHGITLLTIRASESRDRYLAAEHILACVPRQHLLNSIPSITTDFAKAIKSKTRLSKTVYTNRFSTWLELLHRLDSTLGFDRSGASAVDNAIATTAKLIFADRTSAQISPETLLNALVFKLSQQDASYVTLHERLLHLINPVATSTPERGAVPFEDWLGGTFSRMQRESMPYDDLANMIVNLLVRHNDLGLVLRFLTAMEKQKLKISDASALNRLIAEKAAFLQQPKSSQTAKERQHNAFALTTCQRILELLSRITLSPAVSSLATKRRELNALQAQRQFQEILDRAQAAAVLPLAYRNLTADIPLEKRGLLIHQLVHQYSLDNTRSQRQVWRSMYYLYCYLQQYSLPIGPLFSKAVVRVAIARPLSEDRFVSARRLIWVCQLVARVEGEEVAKKIENIFWHSRGDLMKHAKSVYVNVGGDKRGKAHLGTMKKLGLI